LSLFAHFFASIHAFKICFSIVPSSHCSSAFNDLPPRLRPGLGEPLVGLPTLDWAITTTLWNLPRSQNIFNFHPQYQFKIPLHSYQSNADIVLGIYIAEKLCFHEHEYLRFSLLSKFAVLFTFPSLIHPSHANEALKLARPLLCLWGVVRRNHEVYTLPALSAS
jgi:hypothetical protein